MKFEINYYDAQGVDHHSFSTDPEWTVNGNFRQNSRLGLCFELQRKDTAYGEQFTIPHHSLAEAGGNKIQSITLLSDRISRRENDGGALVLPYGSGRLCHTRNKSTAEYMLGVFSEKKWQSDWGNMPLFGAFAAGKASVALVENGQFDFELRLRTAWGKDRSEYVIDPVFAIRDSPADAPLAHDIVIVFAELDGDWRAIGHYYRNYNLNERKLPTLKEKSKNNPDLAYSMKALTVRCRMCVKPVPPKILEQTKDNEPAPRLFLTFENICTIAEEFKAQNVGPAEFNLVGWNHGGHDGAFPQLFPEAEICGGNAKLCEAIDGISRLGYPTSLHDNYFDGYTLAENFNLDDACRDGGEYGAPTVGGGKLGGGQAYRICAQKAVRYAKENFDEVKKRLPHLHGAYYVDVISIIPMKKCHHPGHPLDRQGNAFFYKEIIGLQQKNFNVAMSEGARDWALPELDRAYMVYNNHETRQLFDDEHVPLFQIVYHGFLIYNNCRGSINTWPGSAQYIANYAWGGIPMIYFHHLFNPAWTAAGGWSHDLTFEGPEKLKRDVAIIKKITDDIAQTAPLQEEFIDDYIEHSAALSETVFSGGSHLFVNRGATAAHAPNGVTIPPYSFVKQEGPSNDDNYTRFA